MTKSDFILHFLTSASHRPPFTTNTTAEIIAVAERVYDEAVAARPELGPPLDPLTLAAMETTGRVLAGRSRRVDTSLFIGGPRPDEDPDALF